MYLKVETRDVTNVLRILFSPRKRASMFLPALVCVSVCDHDN